MIPELIERLLGGESADPKALEDALHRIMLGEVPQLQTAGLLVALRVREPDAPTLAACARAMRAHRLAVQTEVQPLIDTCGTGGDRSGSFNISTAAALVVAACGGAVAKHGNRSVSSKAGSADVLEASGAVFEPRTEGNQHLPRLHRVRVSLRSRVPSGDGECRTRPESARGAHVVQLARPPREPGARPAPTHGRVRPEHD